MDQPHLNLAAFHPNTTTLGPGKRFAIWVQGCPFQCKNCVAPNWIPFKIAHPTAVSKLAEFIIASDIDGLTFSGGEPFMQADQLCLLIDLIRRERQDVNVICFSGFTLKQLIWTEAKKLLDRIDVLIAGPYIDKLNDNRGLRGSTNQEIHFLTSIFSDMGDYFESSNRKIEFCITDEGVLMTGIPERGFSW